MKSIEHHHRTDHGQQLPRVLVVAALLAGMAGCDSSSEPSTELTDDAQLIADVSVQDCAGNEIALRAEVAAFEVTYLTFAAQWCTACKEEVPIIKRELVDHFDPARVRVIQLLVEQQPSEPPTLKLCEEWRDQLAAPFPIYVDLQQGTVPVYFGEKVPQLPFHMIVTSDGVIRFQLLGAIPTNIRELVGNWLP